MKALSVLIYSEQPQLAAGIHAALKDIDRVRVDALIGEALDQSIRDLHPDAMFVGLGGSPHRILDMIEALPAPKPALFLVGSQDDTSVLLRSMRLGVVEFLPESPDAVVIRSAIVKLERKRGAAAEVPVEKKPAPVIAVMAAKGGVGATVVACQVAAALQELEGRVAIVDLAHPLGDVAVHFDLQPSTSLAGLSSGDSVDSTWLRNALQTHHSGVRVLAGPSRAEESERIGAEQVSGLLPALRKEFDWVIIDVSHSWTEASVRALDAANQILLVTLMDVPTLNHARKRLDLLRRLGHPRSKVHLVANRYARNQGVSEREVAEFLGRPVDARIPNDYATVARGINAGRLVGDVARSSGLHRAYQQLARDFYGWCGREVPALPEDDAPRDLVARVKTSFRKLGPSLAEPVTPVPAVGARPYQVLTVTSNKGGVAKTTVATNLAVYFRALKEDLPILILSLDDQPMIDRMFALDKETSDENVYSAVRKGTLSGAIRLGQYGVHYVPTSVDVGELKREIEDVNALREVLDRTSWQGLVIIDTKSDFEVLTRNAISAADLSIVVVHDHASLVEARKVYDFLERQGRPRDRARVLLSLVDRRIKFKDSDGEKIDILAHLVGEVRRRGYPLFESFISRSPKVEGLYTNPDGRATSILHGASESLIHLQMSHLGRDVFAILEERRKEEEAAVQPVAPPVVRLADRRPPVRSRWGRAMWSGKSGESSADSSAS
jgi:Flp pilus assembly CpaE family ATPase